MVGLPMSTWIAAVLTFAAVALATISLVLAWELLRQRRQQRGVSQQLERLATEGFGDVSATQQALYRTRQQSAAWVGRLGERFSSLKDAEILIEQADVRWSVQTYLALRLGFAVALGLLVLIPSNNLLLAVAAAVIGAMLPRMYLKHKRTQRMNKYEEQLPDAVDLLGRAIRAGHPVSSGFKMVAEEAPYPISAEFRQVFEEQRFGMPFEDSLLGMADRVPLIDVRIFATAVLIQREVGGNLAEILDNLSDVIRQRFSVLRQLRVFTAQGRMSGYILAALPIFLGLVMFLLNPENMRAFIDAPLGRVMLMVAMVLQVLGFLWIRKIIQIEV